MLAIQILFIIAEVALIALAFVCLAFKAHEQFQDMMIAFLACESVRKGLKDLMDD